MPPCLNETVIVLIPKKNSPKMVTNMCPISFCNVLYKIVSKTLAIRLKSVVGEVVGEFQSAFSEGRLITDNVMVAYQINNFLKCKRQGRTCTVALKLDI